MLFDRLAGRRMEWDARNGVIARRHQHGIATPASDRVTAELAALDGERSCSLRQNRSAVRTTAAVYSSLCPAGCCASADRSLAVVEPVGRPSTMR